MLMLPGIKISGYLLINNPASPGQIKLQITSVKIYPSKRKYIIVNQWHTLDPFSQQLDKQEEDKRQGERHCGVLSF